jgi:hypothetical protein
MENVTLEISEDQILRIEVDLSKELGLSNSGKSIVIGSTKGSILLWRTDSSGPGVRVNVNVTRKPTEAEKREGWRPPNT